MTTEQDTSDTTTSTDDTSTQGAADEAVADTAASAEGADTPGQPSRRERLENEGDVAADFLEELLDIADLDGDIDLDVDGNRASVSIVGGDLDELVGPGGDVLEALQELTRLAVFRETGERSRLMLDVAGFRAQRRAELVDIATQAIAEVQASGETLKLSPMTPFERKVVHDAVADAGLNSESEGVEPRRCVVVLPAT
ncbi:protein jag [Solicola sp. PLA-1-18]|uniref:Jag family protein n=1 Tax=Solicola sp. PLA-1-18 TaxID=3380532 RepID=UPI003B7CCF00